MSQALPKALLVISDGTLQRQVLLTHSPFTIGRMDDRDLILPYPYISRIHAQIVYEEARFYLIDQSSQSGTFVNGRRIQRHPLADEDVIHVGSLQGPQLHFRRQDATTETSLRTLLGQMHDTSDGESSLGKLRWFVEAARRLNNLGAVNEILIALIETTLQLTQVERGYVFLNDPHGKLSLAIGRNMQGEALTDDSTISHSAIQNAITSGSDFIVTDDLANHQAKNPSHSMVVQNLRTVICIPLRRRTAGEQIREAEVLGVLYLDSQQKRARLTRIDSDLLTTIATEVAVLVENAMLAQAEAAGRQYIEELKIASEIQRGLMMVNIPELSYARVDAQSIPCTGIGGDFYDVISLEEALYVVVADVSGKGVSAALLGATLQGLIHSQVLSGQALSQIALFANRYICNKGISKYATLVLLRLSPNGDVEYINCGHVQPLLHSSDGVTSLPNGNFPVGMLPWATYASEQLKLKPGDRILIVTDGVTEAEDPTGECYGDARLQALVTAGARLNLVFDEVSTFTQGAPLADDCTILEVCFADCAT
jgi:phosphoserine phosphatase RsbU/P